MHGGSTLLTRTLRVTALRLTHPRVGLQHRPVTLYKPTHSEIRETIGAPLYVLDRETEMCKLEWEQTVMQRMRSVATADG